MDMVGQMDVSGVLHKIEGRVCTHRAACTPIYEVV